jgi:hypothetical protein
VGVAELLSVSWNAGTGQVWLPADFEVTYAGPGGGRSGPASTGSFVLTLRHACRCGRSRRLRGQRSFPGWYWSATMGRRVGFESWVERGHLVALDFGRR